MTLISAHRCGAGAEHALENTREAIVLATRLDAEFVEFDVQRTADGVFVLFHDDHIEIDGKNRRLDALTVEQLAAATPQFVRYDEALQILAAAGKRAHIDLKFVSPDGDYDVPSSTYEVEATAIAIDTIGPDAMIITSLEDRTVRAIRRWIEPVYPDLLVGLSLGRDMSGRRAGERLRTRYAELFPRTRIKDCDANLVVANKTLARLTLARFAAKRALPLLVWTVDEPDELRRWIRDPRTWLVTTNYPRRALEIRDAADGRGRITRRAALRLSSVGWRRGGPRRIGGRAAVVGVSQRGTVAIERPTAIGGEHREEQGEAHQRPAKAERKPEFRGIRHQRSEVSEADGHPAAEHAQTHEGQSHAGRGVEGPTRRHQRNPGQEHDPGDRGIGEFIGREAVSGTQEVDGEIPPGPGQHPGADGHEAERDLCAVRHAGSVGKRVVTIAMPATTKAVYLTATARGNSGRECSRSAISAASSRARCAARSAAICAMASAARVARSCVMARVLPAESGLAQKRGRPHSPVAQSVCAPSSPFERATSVRRVTTTSTSPRLRPFCSAVTTARRPPVASSGE